MTNQRGNLTIFEHWKPTINTYRSFTVRFFGTPIYTILPTSASAIEEFISRYHPSEEQNLHLGLAIQYNPPLFGKSWRISTLQLCDGDRCLIIQLNDHGSNVPKALKDLLAHRYVYVSGVEIYNDAQLLEDFYGISLAHTMELRNYASRILKRRDLFGSTKERLAELVLGRRGVLFPLDHIVMSNWDAVLRVDQVLCACVSARVSWEMMEELEKLDTDS